MTAVTELGALFCIAKQNPVKSSENNVALCLKDEKKADAYSDGSVAYATIDFGNPTCKSGFCLVGYVPKDTVRQFKHNNLKHFANDRIVTDIPFLCGNEALEKEVPLQEAGIPLFLSSIGASSVDKLDGIDRWAGASVAAVGAIIGGALYYIAINAPATSAIVAVAGVGGGMILCLSLVALLVFLGIMDLVNHNIPEPYTEY